MDAVREGFLEVLRCDLVEFEVTKHGTEICSWEERCWWGIELSSVNFPEDETEELRWMKSVSLFPLNTNNHEFLKKLEELLDLESISWDRGEQIEITPMWIGEFHHNHWIELNIKLESFWILIEKVNESA